jgi:hypothetical protein
MALWKTHPRADLLRYLDGDVNENEKRALEEHLEGCADCRGYLSQIKDFNQGLGELREEEFTSEERCPDSWTLVSYEAGKVDEETALHLRAHLLFCDDCQEEFFALRQLHGPSRTEVILRAARDALECVSLTGSGVLAEPAYAPVRAEEEPVRGRVQIEDTVVDPGTNATSDLRVTIEADPQAPTASVLLDAEPPQPDWKAYLFDADERELASIPIFEHETRLGSGLPYGSYSVSIRRGEDALASLAIEIRAA